MKTRDRIENVLALLETTGDVQYWTNAIANDSDEVSSNERDFVEVVLCQEKGLIK